MPAAGHPTPARGERQYAARLQPPRCQGTAQRKEIPAASELTIPSVTDRAPPPPTGATELTGAHQHSSQQEQRLQMNLSVGHRSATTQGDTDRALPSAAGTTGSIGAYQRSIQREVDPLMIRTVGHRACHDVKPHLVASERAGSILPRESPELTQVNCPVVSVAPIDLDLVGRLDHNGPSLHTTSRCICGLRPHIRELAYGGLARL